MSEPLESLSTENKRLCERFSTLQCIFVARESEIENVKQYIRDRDNFCAICFALSLFRFYSVCIFNCATQSVRRAPVKTSLHAMVLVFRAETSVFANEVTVLS